MDGKKQKIKKTPALYIVMLAVWSLMSLWLWHCISQGFVNVPLVGDNGSLAVRIIAIVLLAFNGIFITYFWLNGVKDFIYVIWYWIEKKKMEKSYTEVISADVSNINDKVLLLYCTCNDFDGESLLKSMQQNYSNFQTVILDDSSKDEYKNLIDDFAKEHGVRVVRRENRVGFKAGNINNFLLSQEMKASDYKYAVILDSDEIIPSDFIVECLKYFVTYDNVGIVQANHVATRNRNFFMKVFHIGVNSHWPTYQMMKHKYGFTSMLGHGAMISRDCYEQAGGFPNLVAEDLCLSIEMRNLGYYIAFAPNVICQEEYPVDYLAFKKRHSKWTQGNLEFIKRYTRKIARSKMKWYEKMDIVLFTYNLPLTAIFSLYIILNVSIMPLLGVDVGKVLPWYMLIPTIIFFVAPMLNDIFSWIGKLNFFKLLFYSLFVMVLYGSMFYTSLAGAVLGMFGKKAKFIVTPKDSVKIGLGSALKFHWQEILFSVILSAVSYLCCRSILPVGLIVATGILSIVLYFFSNKRYGEEECLNIDKKSASATLSLNGIASDFAKQLW